MIIRKIGKKIIQIIRYIQKILASFSFLRNRTINVFTRIEWKILTLSSFHRNKRKHSKTSVIKQSAYRNVYYCCTQRTGSVWLSEVLNDSITFKYTGLIPFPYIELGLKYAHFNKPLPANTIGSHLYIDYPTYLSIQKPKKYKAFFVMRDPRDIVVSFYFAVKHSHPPIGPIPKLRDDLQKLSMKEGFKYIIDKLEEFGLFQTQRSWMQNAKITRDDNIRIFYYEDLVCDSQSFLKQIFNYLDIEFAEEQFVILCNQYRFKKLSKGRKKGDENIYSHYRKGVSGDWENYFDKSTTAYFEKVTKDLVGVLGYEI